MGWFGTVRDDPKVIDNVTIRYSAYDFLLVFNRNYASISYCFTARRYASAVSAVVVCLCICPPDCPSVRHKPVLYRNGFTLDHANNAT